ncbi:MAG: hypothetical protein VX549_13480 [Pseudomonadota bacterium]|nr:hypothetical protein [Pseudomonadota bacterium]
MQYAKLYANDTGTLLAVDETDAARALVAGVTLPRAMFEGRCVPHHVARAFLTEYGGKWMRDDGVHHFQTNPVKKPRPAATNPVEQTLTMDWDPKP